MSQTVLITCEYLGRGDDELGDKLMRSFLRTLLASDKKPDKLVFYNSAVRLLAEDSPVLDILSELNQQGVLLVACGTCVGHFKLDDKITRERVSNMQEIVKILMDSDRVVTV